MSYRRSMAMVAVAISALGLMALIAMAILQSTPGSVFYWMGAQEYLGWGAIVGIAVFLSTLLALYFREPHQGRPDPWDENEKGRDARGP